MKILVPIDFSDPSQAALVEAMAWAAQLRGSLVLLHVIPPVTWSVLSKPRGEAVESAERRLQELRDGTVGAQLSCETHVLEGRPHDEILRFAAAESIDQISMATHGRGGIQHFLLGSTTERVVRGARCSVHIIRQRQDAGGEDRMRGPRGLRRILAATDLTDGSQHAVRAAIRLAEPCGAEVLLTHVLDDADYSMYWVMLSEDWERIRSERESKLQALQRDTCGDAVSSKTLLLEGSATKEILGAAAGHAVDLVVVGPSSGDDSILGATAERVVQGAPCSVYVARPAPDEA